MRTEQNLPAILDFSFETKNIRTVVDNRTNDIFICLADLLAAYETTTRTNQLLPELDEMFEKGYKIIIPLETPGGVQNIIFISKDAAIYVISKSRTEAGKRIIKFIYTEMIPSVRKTGSYTHPKAKLGKRPTLSKLSDEFCKVLKLGKNSGMPIHQARIAANAAVLDRYGEDCFKLLGFDPIEAQLLANNAPANYVESFVNECCVRDGFSRERTKHLFDRYRRWCVDKPSKFIGKKLFYSILREGYVSVKKTGYNYFVGLKII